MSTGRKKLIILSAVFLLAFAIGMMRAPEERTQADEEGSAMTAASLPVLCTSFGDRLINPLYGYTEEMDAASFADSVFPFAESPEMTVTLLDGAAVPESVSWEIRDETGGRLIERGSTSAFRGSRSECSFSFPLQDLYEDETYYRLRFTVEMNGLTARYYTRIRKVSAENLEALTKYALAFHDAQFDKEAAAAYSAKLEPNDQADRGTLAYVDIHCSPDQLSWGDSGAEQSSKTWMTVQAVHGGYGYFRFDYLARAAFAGARPVTLRCRETMTLQKNRDAMYLLRYERHVNQLWEPGDDTVTAKGFLFGVQEASSVQSVSAGDVTAFAVNGDLYAYEAKARKLTRVFSFRRRSEHELRTLRSDCSIRIMSVDRENGEIEFAVSGYMNGGSREGTSGAACYTYKPAEGSLAESVTIASGRSPEMVKQDIGRLFVRGDGGFLYYCLDRQIIAMDPDSGETAVLVGRGEFDSFVQSDDKNAFAWQSGNDRDLPGSVHVMNLKKGKNLTVQAEKGGFIRTFGYIREDLIIGRGRLDAVPLDDGEGGVFPLNSLEILDEELETIMTYAYPGIYISGIGIDSEKITVRRYALTENGEYAAKADDILLRSDSETGTGASPVTSYKHETLKRALMLPMDRMPSFQRITEETSPVLHEGRRQSPADADDAFAGCYAYGGGNCLGSFETAGGAITAAAADYGYVTDAQTGQLVWCWTARRERAEISPGAIRTDLPRSLDLCGINYRSLLYFLDAGIPVRWISPAGGERWIVGYGQQGAAVYDPAARQTSFVAQEELDETILRSDNYLRVFTD